MGRTHTLLDPNEKKNYDTLLGALQKGLSLELASKVVGWPYKTVERWRTAGRKYLEGDDTPRTPGQKAELRFYLETEKHRALAANKFITWLDSVEDEKNRMTVAMWYLTRSHPRDYGLKEEHKIEVQTDGNLLHEIRAILNRTDDGGGSE